MSALHPELVSFISKHEDAKDATGFQCALCGERFTHGTLVCVSCPMNAGCEVVKCPSCGFQFPRRSRVVDLARRLLGAGKRR